MSDKTISLCMIVRDEAALLPKFLHAVDGLWDELCVVDTGSRDETVSILQAAGAKVIHQAWEDDFAAARNTSIRAATSDWIIYLDPDEIVSEETVRSARHVVSQDTAGAAVLTMTHYIQHGHTLKTHLLRMFRNDPSITFKHAIHEDIKESVLHYLQTSQKNLVRLDGVVHHTGYSFMAAKSRNKKERDSHILNQLINKNPHDLYSHFKMLEVARFWEDNALLTDAAERAAVVLQEINQSDVQHLHYLGEMLVLVASGLYHGKVEETLEFLVPWEGFIYPNAVYLLRCGELYEHEGQNDLAQHYFEKCLTLRLETVNTQMVTVRPMLGLARLALMRNDIPETLQLIERALEENHRDPEALLAMATIVQMLGGAEAIKKITEVYRDNYGDNPELHQALEEASMYATQP